VEPSNEDGSEMTETDKQNAREEAYREIRQALNAASKMGHVPHRVKVLIDKEMRSTKSPKEVLTRFLQDALSRSDYSWRRPNRRYLDAGFYLPSLQDESFSKIAAIIDVSGSVSDGMVRDFCAEMQGYIEGIGSDAELLVIYVDTMVTGTEILTQGDSFDLKPNRMTGGTRFEPGFEWLKENSEGALNGVVYYTDGYCSRFPDPSLEPPCPVMWILHSEHSIDAESMEAQIPFGEVLKMPKERD
jgi:predicted metal-dependent peptidase